MAISLLPSLAIGWRVLFLHQIPQSADNLNQFIPYYSFAREMIRGGELPLWNPFSSAGMPFLADPQTGVFYPLNLLHYFLPLDWSVLLLTFLPYPLAAVFVYLYLREIDSGPFEASISALAFTYSGYYLQYSYCMSNVHGMLWLPALFLFGERAVQRHSVGWASLAGLIWAVQVFGGHPQLAYYTFGATIAYLGFRAAAPLLKDWIRGDFWPFRPGIFRPSVAARDGIHPYVQSGTRICCGGHRAFKRPAGFADCLWLSVRLGGGSHGVCWCYLPPPGCIGFDRCSE
jgi:hypothetical protein